MSASTEKKLRRAAREAGNDRKAIAAAEEAAKKAKSKRNWTIGTVCVVLLIAAILFLNSGFLYKSTAAVKIGDEGYSPAQTSYNYAAQYYSFANQYGDYAGIFGLDTSTGISGLGSQPCGMLEDGTWRDYFLEGALGQMLQTKTLLDYAAAEGISLTEDEIAAVDANFANVELMATAYGFANVDNYLAANYGEGVNLDVVRQAELDATLASKAANHYFNSLEYSDAELAAHYESYEGAEDLFDYAYYFVAAETTDVTAEDGTVTQEVSADALTDAKATADAILAELGKAIPGTPAEMLDGALAVVLPEEISTQRSMSAGLSIPAALSQWMMAERAEGDAAVLADEAGEGYYVAVFGSRSDNHYPTAQVRHILIKAVASADGTYSDEAKAQAKARAEELLAEWEAGDKTEDSFAALANEYSEDAGSNTNGGLYDNVAKGQMVDEFDAFCFGGHKSGDTGIVYGETSAYAGYHVMYYVGEGELYSNSIARDDLANTAFNEWLTALAAGYETKETFFMRLVG